MIHNLKKGFEMKEKSLNDLEHEIDIIQHKELELNRKREEIYQ
jgi:hypothetical protein